MSTTTLEPPVLPSVEEVMHAFATDGYMIIERALDPETLEEARAALVRLLEAESCDKDRETMTKRSFGIAVKEPVFRKIACHPLIISIWQEYLGPDMFLSTWSSNTVLPGQGWMNWHADYPYWAMKEPWPEGVLTGQTLWMLDDFSEENGATALVPRSHTRGHKPDGEPKEPHPEQLIAEAPAGSVLVFDGRLWHSSRANASAEPRSALLGMYIRSCCVPMESMRHQLEHLEDPTELETLVFGGKQRQPTVWKGGAAAGSSSDY